MDSKGKEGVLVSDFSLPCEKSSDVSWLQEKLRQTRVGLVAELEKNSAVFGCYMVLDREGVIQYMNLEGLNTLDMGSLQQHGWRLDFPEPEEPMMDTNSPFAISRFIPFRT